MPAVTVFCDVPSGLVLRLHGAIDRPPVTVKYGNTPNVDAAIPVLAGSLLQLAMLIPELSELISFARFFVWPGEGNGDARSGSLSSCTRRLLRRGLHMHGAVSKLAATSLTL